MPPVVDLLWLPRPRRLHKTPWRHPGSVANPEPIDSEDAVPEYLPSVYTSFRERYPDLAGALDDLGRATDSASALDERTARLVTLGIAVGGLAEGAVRSNVRKALMAGATPDEVRSVVLHAISTRGFPAAIAAHQWVDEVLSNEPSG
jgi:4-carboxymuconolactone decarboxylase